MAPMDRLLKLSELFLESVSVSECYFHISKSFYHYYFLIHPYFLPSVTFPLSILFCLMLVSAL